MQNFTDVLLKNASLDCHAGSGRTSLQWLNLKGARVRANSNLLRE
jgi:hypothetical protein